MTNIILGLLGGIALGIFLGVNIIVAILSVWARAGGLDFETGADGIERMIIKRELK